MPNEYSDFECLTCSSAPSADIAFKRLCNELDERERKVVQHQIDFRVAEIISLIREVQKITHCKHEAIYVMKSNQDIRLIKRCQHCRAWLE